MTMSLDFLLKLLRLTCALFLPFGSIQHCVMRSEGDGNKGARASVVFKRALPDSKGNKGHGARHHTPDKPKQQRGAGPGRGKGGGRQGQSFKGRGGGRGRPAGRGAGHKRVGRPANV